MGIQHPIQPGAALRLLSSSGEVVVTAEDRDDLDVEPPDGRVEMKDGGRTAEVKSRSAGLRVRCPRGTDVSVGVISGQVRLAGEFGSVKVSAVSGHIEIDSASGDVDVRRVSGHVSGHLSATTCGGRGQLNTKSGQIRIGHVEKAARVSTLSGSVELGTAGEEDVEVKSISGRVTVRVAEGRRPHVKIRTLSGKLHCDCPQGTDFD